MFAQLRLDVFARRASRARAARQAAMPRVKDAVWVRALGCLRFTALVAIPLQFPPPAKERRPA